MQIDKVSTNTNYYILDTIITIIISKEEIIRNSRRKFSRGRRVSAVFKGFMATKSNLGTPTVWNAGQTSWINSPPFLLSTLNRDTNLIPEVSACEIISLRIACWPPLRRFSINIPAIFQTISRLIARDDPARLKRDRVTDRGKFQSPRRGDPPFHYWDRKLRGNVWIIFDEKSLLEMKGMNEYFSLVLKRKL